MKHTLVSDTALGNSCNKICLSVLIPEWAWVNPACTWSYVHRLTPLTIRVCCCSHIYSFIRHWKAHIICTLMISYGRCPHSASMNWISISEFWNFRQNVVNNLPVYKVLRMKQRHSRCIRKA